MIHIVLLKLSKIYLLKCTDCTFSFILLPRANPLTITLLFFKFITQLLHYFNPRITAMENFRVKEAAKYLGVAVNTIWQYSKEGKIKAVKLSDRVTIWTKSELDRFITSRIEA